MVLSHSWSFDTCDYGRLESRNNGGWRLRHAHGRARVAFKSKLEVSQRNRCGGAMADFPRQCLGVSSTVHARRRQRDGEWICPGAEEHVIRHSGKWESASKTGRTGTRSPLSCAMAVRSQRNPSKQPSARAAAAMRVIVCLFMSEFLSQRSVQYLPRGFGSESVRKG